MKANEGSKVMDELLMQFIRRQVDRGTNSFTADVLGHSIDGRRIMQLYAADMSRPRSRVVATQILRGIIYNYKA